MNFKQATDALLESITLETLASELGVSVQSLRQARATQGSTAFRPPPNGWESGVARVAAKRANQLSRLAKSVKP